jgi:hypothetical protein
MAALRNRDFALLWMGQSVSLLGNGIFTVAFPLEVLRITGSPLALALAVGARMEGYSKQREFADFRMIG